MSQIDDLIRALEIFKKHSRGGCEIVIRNNLLIIEQVYVGDLSDEEQREVQDLGFWFNQDEWRYANERFKED